MNNSKIAFSASQESEPSDLLNKAFISFDSNSSFSQDSFHISDISEIPQKDNRFLHLPYYFDVNCSNWSDESARSMKWSRRPTETEE